MAFPLLGGGIIGLAVSLMLLLNGRVTGISGIVASALAKPSAFDLWRWTFLIGMIFGGAVMFGIRPELFANTSDRSFSLIATAGLLVGFGTVMGSGCTSGHGICGISRFSIRSLIATVTFILFGFFSVQAMRFFVDGSI